VDGKEEVTVIKNMEEEKGGLEDSVKGLKIGMDVRKEIRRIEKGGEIRKI